MVLRGLASALTWRRCLVSPPVPARPSPTPTCARQTCPDTALGSTVAGSCSAAREPGSGWPGRRLEPALALWPGWPRSCWAPGAVGACGQARGWAASEGRPGEQVGLRRARQARQAWAGEASAGGRAVAPGRPALATGVHCLWPCVAQDPRPRPACPRFAADLCVAGPRRPGADAGRGRGCGLPRDPLSWGPGGSLRGPGLRTGGRQGRREPRPRLSRPGSLRGPVSCCPSKGLALEALAGHVLQPAGTQRGPGLARASGAIMAEGAAGSWNSETSQHRDGIGRGCRSRGCGRAVPCSHTALLSLGVMSRSRHPRGGCRGPWGRGTPEQPRPASR